MVLKIITLIITLIPILLVGGLIYVAYLAYQKFGDVLGGTFGVVTDITDATGITCTVEDSKKFKTETGQSCECNDECQSKWCNSTTKKCDTQLKSGMPCPTGDEQQCISEDCDCTTPHSSGDTCFCDPVDIAPLVENGLNCKDDDWCQSGWCNSTTKKCDTKLKSGMPCPTGDEQQCISEDCDCTTPHSSGDTCFCDPVDVAPLVEDGLNCKADDWCQSGFCGLETRKCEQTRQVGGSCYSNDASCGPGGRCALWQDNWPSWSEDTKCCPDPNKYYTYMGEQYCTDLEKTNDCTDDDQCKTGVCARSGHPSIRDEDGNKVSHKMCCNAKSSGDVEYCTNSEKGWYCNNDDSCASGLHCEYNRDWSGKKRCRVVCDRLTQYQCDLDCCPKKETGENCADCVECKSNNCTDGKCSQSTAGPLDECDKDCDSCMEGECLCMKDDGDFRLGIGMGAMSDICVCSPGPDNSFPNGHRCVRSDWCKSGWCDSSTALCNGNRKSGGELCTTGDETECLSGDCDCNFGYDTGNTCVCAPETNIPDATSCTGGRGSACNIEGQTCPEGTPGAEYQSLCCHHYDGHGNVWERGRCYGKMSNGKKCQKSSWCNSNYCNPSTGICEDEPSTAAKIFNYF